MFLSVIDKFMQRLPQRHAMNDPLHPDHHLAPEIQKLDGYDGYDGYDLASSI
jgi:hypothetical protein